MKLQTDQGKEFLNTNLQTLLKSQEIKSFRSTDDVIKCAVVERLNGTIRSRIYRYLFANSSKRYIDALQNIVQSYNSSYHRTIRMTPINVQKKTRPQLL